MKKCLKDTTKTVLLVSILIALFIAINLLINKIDFPDIDITQNKLYTLTEESKQKVKEIQEEVHIYVVGAVQDSAIIDLIKQYSKANSKISYETIEDITTRPEISAEYGIESDTIMIIKTQNKNQILSYSDLYTYDYTTYEQIDITEQKITNAMVNLTIEKKPVIYFLTGHNEYSTKVELTRLIEGLENDVNTVETLDLLVTQKIPEDTSALVIGTPTKDFETLEADLLIQYIQNGGKILWLNDPDFTGLQYSNIQRVLDQFGVKLDNGIVIEQDANKMVLQTGNFILPEVEYTNATKNISTDGGVMLINSGKISLEESEKLEELGVEAQGILTTSQNAIFRTDTSNSSNTKIDSDIEGSFTLGYKLIKNDEATMYIIANNIFASDAQIKVQNQYSYSVEFYNNKDFLLNLLADLTKRQDNITIRKDIGAVTYTATKQQDTIIKWIIFVVPVVIILIGVIIGAKRNGYFFGNKTFIKKKNLQ